MRVAYSVKPLACAGELGRDRQLLAGGDHVDQRRAVVRERRAQRVLELAGVLDADAVKPDRAGDVGEVRVVEVGAVVDDARRPSSRARRTTARRC